MPALSLQTTACVLAKRQPTESHLPYVLFSQEHGTISAWLRLGRSNLSVTPQVDLFDDIEATLTSTNQGQTWFFKEARVLTRRQAIGRAYASLKHASAFTAVLVRNAVPQESRSKAAALLKQALDAFAGETHAPEVVYLKALYSFARDEGYPVGQEWVQELQPALKEAARDLLFQPLGDISPDSPARASADKLIRRLENYLRERTDILMD